MLLHSRIAALEGRQLLRRGRGSCGEQQQEEHERR